jgi:hypothetical protein
MTATERLLWALGVGFGITGAINGLTESVMAATSGIEPTHLVQWMVPTGLAFLTAAVAHRILRLFLSMREARRRGEVRR